MKTLSLAGKRAIVVFAAMIAAFFLLVDAGAAMASLTPPEGAKGEGEKTQYVALHHPAPCINFVGGPMMRTVCVGNSSIPYTFKEGTTFSSRFSDMLVLWHDNAAIPLTSWLWIVSQGSRGISVSLSDGYNEPYAEGQGSTFSEAVENLFFNVFPHHGEKEELSKIKE